MRHILSIYFFINDTLPKLIQESSNQSNQTKNDAYIYRPGKQFVIFLFGILGNIFGITSLNN